MITSAIKEMRRPLAVKRVLRLRESSYSQIRYYFSLEKFSRPNNYGSWKSESKQEISSRKFFSSARMSTSVDCEEDNSAGITSINALDFEETSFDHTVDESEDDLAHLRIKLYEMGEDNETNEYMERLYDAASIQQVFDVVQESGENLKVLSQALVTIWDLQKLIFRISTKFEPERDFLNRPTFIAKVSQNSLFLEKIVKPIITNYKELDDEPLAACLLCLNRFGYKLRESECQNLIEECLRRKESLSLPSISRLFVCLRTESLYGMFICGQFFPNLAKSVDSMSDDIEVRLVSISLRNSLRIVSEAMVDKFRARIAALADDISLWETVTLCKVFLLLISCQHMGSVSKHVLDAVGEELIGRVPNMQIMDLLSLQTFLEGGHIHPYGLVEALVKRMLRVVQEGVSSSINPRLDLLASIAPHLKSMAQRKQLAVMLENYLENHNFEMASGILFVILRWSKSKNSIKLYDSFWQKAADMVDDKNKKFDRRLLKLGTSYLNFIYGLQFGYRHKGFELSLKRYLYQLIDNYTSGAQPCLIQPSDFARAFGFLIGCATLSDSLFHELDLIRVLDDFSPQLRPGDIFLLSRGLEAQILNLFYPKKPSKSKYYEVVLEICSILEEQCSRILLHNAENIGLAELLVIHKSALVTRRVKGESPILDVTMQHALKCELDDPKSIKDLTQHLLNGLNNYPDATQKIEDFIWNSRNSSISPELIEKFVILSFCLGREVNSDKDVYEFCSTVLTKHWDKLGFLGLLQASLALCYFRRLSKELVQNIFSLEFLDQIDAELASSCRVAHYPMKLRQAMMELNRAVCIDMPDVNLPWFHEKFCQELLAMNKFQETYMHKEVGKVLGDVVGDYTAVQPNMISPYYYNLDFLIEFDEKSRPIRKNRSPPQAPAAGFLKKLRGTTVEQVSIARKVAVLILTPHSFTKSLPSLKGQLILRRNHLEILGYDVIEISPVTWNSLKMSSKTVRHNFIESQLYANMNN